MRTGFNLRPGHSGFLHMWESCRTMPLVGRFSRGYPVSPAPSFRRYFIHGFNLIGTQDHDVKRRPNLFTHSSLSQLGCVLGNRRGIVSFVGLSGEVLALRLDGGVHPCPEHVGRTYGRHHCHHLKPQLSCNHFHSHLAADTCEIRVIVWAHLTKKFSVYPVRQCLRDIYVYNSSESHLRCVNHVNLGVSLSSDMHMKRAQTQLVPLRALKTAAIEERDNVPHYGVQRLRNKAFRSRVQDKLHIKQALDAAYNERGSGGAVARALAYHHGDPGSIPGGLTPGFSHVEIVMDDAAWVFSGYPPPPPLNSSAVRG
ncbi:hypothetical protein PR048_007687 [Dryococelus australis]|uniref:Uncharacterized protein n=1 Tax=Dryococelus australis TaxID=614101 RepID=A0ABQ9HV60_9NEOP|nr:hypothetical protein PR048_007687 [Dryococelus australis]